MLVSYHNHTSWSDGKPTIADQVAEAERIGLDEVGVADHLVLQPDGSAVAWSMPIARLDDYLAELRAAGDSARIPLRVGIEADYFPESVMRLQSVLAARQLDYVIGSVHYVEDFPIDARRAHWETLDQHDVDRIWRLYWARMRGMAESRLFDFAAHLDLPKKFGFRPSVDLSADEDAALDAIAAADMAIEINTAGWSLPAREAYPSPSLLLRARARGIPLLINADAHQTAHLTRDFGRARDLARDAGYTELVRYESRRRHPYPL